jgi:hypothetical protein
MAKHPDIQRKPPRQNCGFGGDPGKLFLANLLIIGAPSFSIWTKDMFPLCEKFNLC